MFATVCCDFLPRCALESGTVSEPRLAHLIRALSGSKYSIHDLSRCTGEGSENFTRFNMPLELGMAMARRVIEPASEHDWMVLVPQGHAYIRYISDLAAYDPATHDGSAAGVVVAVMAWLATRKEAIPSVDPRAVLAILPLFTAVKEELSTLWGGFHLGPMSLWQQSKSPESLPDWAVPGSLRPRWRTMELRLRSFDMIFERPRKAYAGEKPYYEFWQGEAIQKSTPNWLHGLVQRILIELLSERNWNRLRSKAGN